MSYDESNPFAKILRGELPCHKVYEDERMLAFMDIMPRSEGHALVIPKAKARNIFDVDPDDLAELIKVVQIVARASKRAFGAEGVTIQQFNDGAGGQVVFHLHFHVLPRWEGIALKPPGQMGKPEVVAANAEKLRHALQAG